MYVYAYTYSTCLDGTWPAFFTSSLSVDPDFLHRFIHSILSPRFHTFVQDGTKTSSFSESAMYIFISRWPRALYALYAS